jgi:hypothetical protein
MSLRQPSGEGYSTNRSTTLTGVRGVLLLRCDRMGTETCDFAMTSVRVRQLEAELMRRASWVASRRRSIETKLSALNSSVPEERSSLERHLHDVCSLGDQLYDALFDLKHTGRESAHALLLSAAPLPQLVTTTQPSPDADRNHTKSSISSGARRELTRTSTSSTKPISPSDPTRVATGRHYKRLKADRLQGANTLEELRDRFYHYTADTHGGKARHGKRGAGYITKGGKRVRKK